MMTEGINILKGDGQFFTLRVLNFFSPRSFFFTVFAKREGFINLFFLFKFLDFPGRSAKMP
jgi:hypothetical protein